MSTASDFLALYEKGIKAILNGAQSYTIGGRSLTRANLSELEAGRDKYTRIVFQESRGGMPVRGITTIDN